MLSIKSLLAVTAAIELVGGMLLLAVPSWASKLLLGAELDSPQSLMVARIGGAGLLAIGVSCWQSRNLDRHAKGLIAGLLVYNVSYVGLLLYAGMVERMPGIGVWPTIILHIALTVWCVARLRALPVIR